MTSDSNSGALGALYASLPQLSRANLLSGRPVAISQQSEETRRVYRETLYLANSMDDLDERIPPVAFPRVDEGMFLSGGSRVEDGYIVKSKGEEDVPADARAGFLSYDELAQYVHSGELKAEDGIATATRSVITLSLFFQRIAPNSPRIEDRYRGQPKPTSAFSMLSQLPPAFVAKLRQRGAKLAATDGGD